MHMSQKEILEQDVFEHPHANIVREVVVAFLERIALEQDNCTACLDARPFRLEYSTPRQNMHLRLNVDGEIIKPINVRFERRGHLPVEKRRLRLAHDAYASSITALPFFRKHNFNRYVWKETKTTFQVNHTSSHLFDCLRQLEDFCVFRIDIYTPDSHKVISNEGRLRVYISLRDELKEKRDYDFLASITINCPKEAERLTAESNQRKKDQQARFAQPA